MTNFNPEQLVYETLGPKSRIFWEELQAVTHIKGGSKKHVTDFLYNEPLIDLLRALKTAENAKLVRLEFRRLVRSHWDKFTLNRPSQSHQQFKDAQKIQHSLGKRHSNLNGKN